MQKIKIFSILLISVIFFYGMSQVAFAQTQATTDIGANVASDVAVSPSDLDVSNVGTLPTSPFYFLKEWGRSIRRLVTFNPVARAQLELNIANQKAAEVVVVDQEKPDDQSAIQRALDNYQSSQEKLKEKLSSLQGSSDNPNIANLISNIDARLQKHQQVFEKLSLKFSEQGKTNANIINNLRARQDGIEQVLSEAGNKDANIKNKAQEALTNAEKAVADLKAAMNNLASKETIIVKEDVWSAVKDRVIKLNERLTKAKQLFQDGKYGQAFGLAVSVRVEAQAMLMKIKRLEMVSNSGKMMAPKEGTTDNKGENKLIRPCLPRPACLDATPRCMIAEPAEGWCPKTEKDNSGSQVVCPQLAPACGSSLQDCLKSALALNGKYPRCEYEKICRQCNYTVKTTTDVEVK